jgi:hypothetical protein
LQNRGKHRPRLLTEKPLRRSRAICPRQEKMVNGARHEAHDWNAWKTPQAVPDSRRA